MDLSEKEKKLIFWASFLALLSAGIGFVLRSLGGNTFWGAHFEITDGQVSALFGAGLWPIAITMILFSLLVDKIGYKVSMMFAFVLQAIGAVLTIFASSFDMMMAACLVSGLGHGVVEAVINPLCASMYRKEKSKWLNILHASWPAGIFIGGIAWLTLFKGGDGMDWAGAAPAFWFMLMPVIAYAVMFLMCKKFPVDERVENNVPMSEMLKEFGGLGAFIAITFIAYEIINQLVGYGAMAKLEGTLMFWPKQLEICLIIGLIGGTLFGGAVKSKGKWMFFVLCLIMIPLATAEIATDGWIQALMKPTMGKAAGWALVFSAGIMMVLRFFAGIPLKYMSPPGLLLLSSVCSIIGLFALASVDGALVWVAFIFYAVGQTFYWPTVLGFVSEQFPKGGAMTLNTVSAMGLLTVGIFGFAFLGTAKDGATVEFAKENQTELVTKLQEEGTTFKNKEGEEQKIFDNGNFFGVSYPTVIVEEFKKKLPDDKARVELQAHLDANVGRSVLRRAALLPLIMAVAFLLIMLYYRSIGGYKPVVLADEMGGSDDDGGSDAPSPAPEATPEAPGSSPSDES
jgi:fucose permease